VINATNILAVAFGWLLLPHFGRRPLFLVGLVSLGGTLVVLGILAFVKQSPANLYAQGAMLVVQSFWFQANINPLSYAIAGEIPATRLRPQTIAMGRAFYVVTTVPLNQLLPYMLNQKPAGWGWGTKSAWFWLGCNILATLWVYFRLPEYVNHSGPQSRSRGLISPGLAVSLSPNWIFYSPTRSARGNSSTLLYTMSWQMERQRWNTLNEVSTTTRRMKRM
jgi:hypothetical protein